jgi:glycosyltransferase involved in cell wall biosynthesis
MLSFALNVFAIGVVRKRPDVIIGSSPHLLAALSAYVLAKFKGSRFYLEVRDLWPQTLIDMREWEVTRRGGERATRRVSAFPRLQVSASLLPHAITVMILRRIEVLLYRRAYRIIVLSEGAEKYIAGRGVDPDKISLLPNGVYLEQFLATESRTDVRARLGLTDRFVVMYAGAHGSANALDTIIRSAAIVKERTGAIRESGKARKGESEGASDWLHRSPVFVMVGDGPCKAELRQMAIKEGLDNVKMLPAVPKRSIPDMLNAADALVITLRWVKLFSYGVSPNKLFEYMASGKAILCAVDGEVASLVGRAEAGIVVEPENAEDLAQAVLSLVKDRERCSAYGANGRRFVKENFSRSIMVKGLISMLDT